MKINMILIPNQIWATNCIPEGVFPIVSAFPVTLNIALYQRGALNINFVQIA